MERVPHTREGNGMLGVLYNSNTGVNRDIDIGCLSFIEFREYLYKKIFLKSICEMCTITINTLDHKQLHITLKDKSKDNLSIQMTKKEKRQGWVYNVNGKEIHYKKDLLPYLDTYLGYRA